MTLTTLSLSPTPGRNHRFTVEQYHRMAETGVLRECDRVELLNGEIVDMSPIGKEHSGVVDQLAACLHSAGQGKVIIRVRNPLLLDDRSEPEPDLAVLKFRADYYRKRLPEPGDVILLIEVADSSLETDRRVKIPLYAAVGIPEVWLVHLDAKSVEVFREPVGGQHRLARTFKCPAAVVPAGFAEFGLKMDELFPD